MPVQFAPPRDIPHDKEFEWVNDWAATIGAMPARKSNSATIPLAAADQLARDVTEIANARDALVAASLDSTRRAAGVRQSWGLLVRVLPFLRGA